MRISEAVSSVDRGVVQVAAGAAGSLAIAGVIYALLYGLWATHATCQTAEALVAAAAVLFVLGAGSGTAAVVTPRQRWLFLAATAILMTIGALTLAWSFDSTDVCGGTE